MGKGSNPGGTGVVLPQHALLSEDARLEDRLDQGKDAFIFDPKAHPVQQSGVRDLIETGFGIALHDPLVGVGGEVADLGHTS